MRIFWPDKQHVDDLWPYLSRLEREADLEDEFEVCWPVTVGLSLYDADAAVDFPENKEEANDWPCFLPGWRKKSSTNDMITSDTSRTEMVAMVL